ncbi:antibiotic biosynthesis monooxygenase [Nakamurella sp. YIM 132087]|uniref:Antibiotic biosynthesis monooxygenase n=1 Tax=Nakamurella alba TaxID=2665158 RepID=A0A7K1FNA3_9ACTN|nr:putative quinol monooxygenase [Nakamurella alba]MTD15560.1 antibiotic biosynthesis monooxygenase [Nakamurella alba]
MADLEVVAVLTAKPGSEAVLRDALAALVEPTLAEEGCLDYKLFSSLADPTVFITTERWRAQSDLDAHMRSPHIRTALGVFGEHLAAPPGIHPLAPVA